MAEWKLLDEAEAKEIWDRQLIRFDDCSPYQTYDWGQYQKSLGWQPYHFIAENDSGETSAMVLGFLRRYPLGIGLMWCPGGPVGEFESWDENLPKAVKKLTNLNHLYMRFRCDQERKPDKVLFLNHRKWNRSIYTITSNVSMELDLSVNDDILKSQLSRNWRRNLKTARENNLVVKLWMKPDVEEICRVYREMESRKNLTPQFSEEKLINLFKHSGSNLIVYRCEDADGNLLCFRGFLKCGNRGGDYLAATTECGLNARASYATLWELLQKAKEQGIKYYDLGGIDPWENPGVYKFKKETGARAIEYLGEWDWANSSLLRLLGNWAIWKKQNLRNAKSFNFDFRKSLASLNKLKKMPEIKTTPQIKKYFP
jgi:hypothetical protein